MSAPTPAPEVTKPVADSSQPMFDDLIALMTATGELYSDGKMSQEVYSILWPLIWNAAIRHLREV